MEGNYASKPDALTAINSAMDALKSAHSDLMSGSRGDMNANRVDTISKARDLIATLETPLESIIWMAWAEVRMLDPQSHCHGFLRPDSSSPRDL